MENSLFIFGSQDITIEKLHICTWDLKNQNALIEIGFEIQNTNYSEDQVYSQQFSKNQTFQLTLAANFLKKVKTESSIKCLAKNFDDDANCLSIFNDTVAKRVSIFNSKDEKIPGGSEVTFKDGDRVLTILPISQKKLNSKLGTLDISIKVPTGSNGRIYSRILIEIESETLAIQQRGIAKSMYIFDIKINEKRNLSNDIHDQLFRNRNLSFCTVTLCFCFHIVPNTYEISFIDGTKIRNIRELESESFRKYLDLTEKQLTNKEYMIIFNKAEQNDTKTFFSIFSKEIIGSKQIILAITANILCSLLFAFGSLDNSYKLQFGIYDVPVTYFVGFIVLVSLLGYLFLGKLLSFLRINR